MNEDTKTEDNEALEEMGAFAFMAPKTDDNEVSFALFDENDKKMLSRPKLLFRICPTRRTYLPMNLTMTLF